MMKTVLLSMIAVSVASTAFAYRGHHGGGYGRGGYHRPPPPRHHHDDNFEEGVLAGLLLSTSALFLSEISNDRTYAVYMNADSDAAEYLAVGGEPTAQLQQAMNVERKFLAKAQVQGSESLSDKEVAYLVMKRAESL
ncbi:hypothetical protein [Bdellovibrio sp. HCB2-146]|uniref:hypothetical protein n=1 Tax=Bdellovibrio sp. HCB2-146 TaxID=3394362 RepID=UPI0039BD7987